MKLYTLKVPEPMIDRWREIAKMRGTNVSQMIREAVNRDIGEWERQRKKRGQG